MIKVIFTLFVMVASLFTYGEVYAQQNIDVQNQSAISAEQSDMDTTGTKFPVDLSGTIYHYTNNNTKPPGTWIITGTWNMKIIDNKSASFIADVTQARVDANATFDTRNEHTHQITNFEPTFVSISDSQIILNGTADNIQNGEMRFQDIPLSITIVGGSSLPYSQIFVKQGGEASQYANGATPWHGTVSQKIS